MHASWFLAVGTSLAVLCTEVTFGNGSLQTERNLDMSNNPTCRFIFITVVVYSMRSN